MPTTYIYVFKWFKVSKKTRKTSEVCKKPVLQNKTGGCYTLIQVSSVFIIQVMTRWSWLPYYIRNDIAASTSNLICFCSNIIRILGMNRAQTLGSPGSLVGVLSLTFKLKYHFVK